MFDNLIQALEYHAEFLPENPNEWEFHHRVVIGKIRSDLRQALKEEGFSPQQIELILSVMQEDYDL
jgi:O-methyltransferase involved in polyketide biosynthesis